jgi:hypothetical protein
VAPNYRNWRIVVRCETVLRVEKHSFKIASLACRPAARLYSRCQELSIAGWVTGFIACGCLIGPPLESPLRGPVRPGWPRC